MNVGKTLDVEAAFAAGVLAEFSEKLFLSVVAKHHIESDVLLARRKGDEHPVGFFSARVNTAVMAEADDAGTPHDWFFFRGGLHDGRNNFAIVADLLVLYRSKEIGSGFFGFFGFWLGHRYTLQGISALLYSREPLEAIDTRS